tara:strand:+ start:1114 stop:1953 length:840 start_codon:yes stop_codon:yes gene_type:complete
MNAENVLSENITKLLERQDKRFYLELGTIEPIPFFDVRADEKHSVSTRYSDSFWERNQNESGMSSADVEPQQFFEEGYGTTFAVLNNVRPRPFGVIHVEEHQCYVDIKDVFSQFLEYLHPTGVVILGGANPNGEKSVVSEPSDSAPYHVWQGDLWKMIIEYRSGYEMEAFTTEDGLGVLWKRPDQELIREAKKVASSMGSVTTGIPELATIEALLGRRGPQAEQDLNLILEQDPRLSYQKGQIDSLTLENVTGDDINIKTPEYFNSFCNAVGILQRASR